MSRIKEILQKKALLLGSSGLSAGAAFTQGFRGQRPPQFPFHEVDRDNNGAISQEEWNSFHEKLFSEIDENGDGTITADELKEHHKQKFGEMRN